MTVGRLRVFVAMPAVLMSRGGVFLGVVVLTDIVKMCRLKVMMSRRLMVSRRLQVMLTRRVLCRLCHLQSSQY
jgi:hypothetical protein